MLDAAACIYGVYSYAVVLRGGLPPFLDFRLA
jgi:hypothetical protein